MIKDEVIAEAPPSVVKVVIGPWVDTLEVEAWVDTLEVEAWVDALEVEACVVDEVLHSHSLIELQLSVLQ